jgi:prolipoprotein diacylglyceryltransferase
MKQNFFMVYFLGVPLGGRIVLHMFKWQNLHKKKIVSAP